MEMQQRLEKLEKERWTYLGLGSLAVVAGLLGALMGAGIMGPGGEVIHARQIQLRGAGESLILLEPGGKPRVALGLSDAGLPSLQFWDKEHKHPRQVVGLTPSGNPQVQFFDEEGHSLAELHINEDGLPMLDFFDNSQTRRESVGLEVGGDPILAFYNLSKQEEVKLGSHKMEFFDITGQHALLRVDTTGLDKAKLELFNNKGQTIFTAPPVPQPKK
jgi:hypothetical protein